MEVAIYEQKCLRKLVIFVSLSDKCYAHICTHKQKAQNKGTFQLKRLKPLHDIVYPNKITNKNRQEYFSSDQYFHSPLSFQQNTVIILQKSQSLLGTRL